MEKTPIAERMLAATDEHFPDVREMCREYRRGAKDDLCLVESSVTYAYAANQMYEEGYSRHNSGAMLSHANLATQLCALSNWRYTRSIYRFHETLYDELIDQPLDILPMDLLYSLPEPSVFIETPENKYTGNGFFAHFDNRDSKYYLLLTFLSPHYSTLEIPIETGVSIRQIVFDMLSTIHVSYDIKERAHFEVKCRMVLNLLLYLCCSNVDYSGRMKPKKQEQWVEKKATAYRKIGFIIGEKIRISRETATKASEYKVKPHIRKAHWHTYWIGKRGNQTRILNWVEPVFVNETL